MRKLLIALFILAVTSTSVFAQHRGHNGVYRNGHSHQHVYRNGGGGHGHYNGHHGSYNAAPWIAGAIGLGILGAIVYDQYGRRCWNEEVAYDNWGNPIIRRFCD